MIDFHKYRDYIPNAPALSRDVRDLAANHMAIIYDKKFHKDRLKLQQYLAQINDDLIGISRAKPKPASLPEKRATSNSSSLHAHDASKMHIPADLRLPSASSLDRLRKMRQGLQHELDDVRASHSSFASEHSQQYDQESDSRRYRYDSNGGSSDAAQQTRHVQWQQPSPPFEHLSPPSQQRRHQNTQQPIHHHPPYNNIEELEEEEEDEEDCAASRQSASSGSSLRAAASPVIHSSPQKSYVAPHHHGDDDRMLPPKQASTSALALQLPDLPPAASIYDHVPYTAPVPTTATPPAPTHAPLSAPSASPTVVHDPYLPASAAPHPTSDPMTHPALLPAVPSPVRAPDPAQPTAAPCMPVQQQLQQMDADAKELELQRIQRTIELEQRLHRLQQMVQQQQQQQQQEHSRGLQQQMGHRMRMGEDGEVDLSGSWSSQDQKPAKSEQHIHIHNHLQTSREEPLAAPSSYITSYSSHPEARRSQQDRDRGLGLDALRGSVDLSGLSVTRLRELTGSY